MVSRGPCNLHVLRNCWTHGVIDENTLVWGQGLADWLPVKNVRTLIPQIRTMEGKLLARCSVFRSLRANKLRCLYYLKDSSLSFKNCVCTAYRCQEELDSSGVKNFVDSSASPTDSK